MWRTELRAYFLLVLDFALPQRWADMAWGFHSPFSLFSAVKLRMSTQTSCTWTYGTGPRVLEGVEDDTSSSERSWREAAWGGVGSRDKHNVDSELGTSYKTSSTFRDHDDDVSLAEACRKLNEVIGLKGMSRYGVGEVGRPVCAA